MTQPNQPPPSWVPVAAIAAVAALLATLSEAAPTGLAAWDMVLKAALTAITVFFAAQAPRWVIVVLLTGAIALAGTTIWFLVGLVGLLGTIAAAWFEQRVQWVGALTGAIAVQVLLRLPSFGPFGLQSLLSGVLILFVCWKGYEYSSAMARRVTRRSITAVAIATVLLLVVGLVGVVSAKADLERGIEAARRGVSAARAADTGEIETELAFAQQALLDGEAQLNSPFTKVLQLIPVAAQHYTSVSTAAGEGAEVLGVASRAVNEADISSIRLSAGSVDLSALEEMAPTLQEMSLAVTQAQAAIEDSRSGWTLPLVRDRIDELLIEVDELAPEVELAAQAAQVLPRMLGSDAPRRYFVIFGTPAESRELGGLLGSWALIEFDQGSVDLLESGRIFELYDLALANTISEPLYPEWYLALGRPIEFPQNLTSSPDFDVVARAGREVFAGVGDGQIDGFIYLDAWAIIDLLSLTGPIEVPFQDEPLSHDNAAQFFFEDQYLIEGRRTDTFDELAVVLAKSIERLADLELPGPERLGEVLGPAARAGRLQMMTFNVDENEFLDSVHLQRDFRFEQGRDFMALVQSTGTAGKLDLYLRRTVAYDVQVDADGQLFGQVTVELASTVPADAPERNVGDEQGTNSVLLSLYSPHLLTEVLVDGQPTQLETAIEFGYPRYLIEVQVPPNAPPVTITYRLEGQVDPDDDYQVEVWHQPLVNDDDVSIKYRGPGGAFSERFDLVENTFVSHDGLAFD